jgi:HEAT repeat protein
VGSPTTRDILSKGQFKRLARLAPGVALRGAREALSDPDWKVRRNGLRVLDHSNDSEAVPKIIELLKDEHENVRKWAAHALGCDRCKTGDGLSIDPVPFLVEVAERDVSLVVQRSAVVCLAWNRPVDPAIGEFLYRLAESEDDDKIRLHAVGGSERHSMPASAV